MPDIITDALLTSIRTAYNKKFQDGFDRAKENSFYDRLATTIMSADASETYGWLGDAPDMREWTGPRQIKSLKEHSYQVINKTFEATVGVPADAIKDDRYATYGVRMENLGYSAAVQPDQMVADLMKNGDTSLCYDGQNFFDTDHPVNAAHDGTGAVTSVSNILAGGAATDPQWFLLSTRMPLKPFIHQLREPPKFVRKESQETSDYVFMNNEYVYGVNARRNVGYGLWQQAIMSRASLDKAAFDEAFEMMTSFKRDGNRPMGLQPDLLVVPPKLRSAARDLIEAERNAAGASNTNFKAVDLLVVGWLA